MSGKIIGIFVLLSLALLGCVSPQQPDDGFPDTPNNPSPNSPDNNRQVATQELRRFSSVVELQAYLQEQQQNTVASNLSKGLANASRSMAESSSIGAPAPAMDGATGASDYSQTNVQVQGVDEADMVKNDNRYLYALSGNKLVIIDGLDADGGTIVSQTDLKPLVSGLEEETANDNDYYRGLFYPKALFVKDNRVLVLIQSYEKSVAFAPFDLEAYDSHRPKTVLLILEVSDHAQPTKLHEISTFGNYSEARLIENTVYFIAQENQGYYGSVIQEPLIKAGTRTISPEIYYFDNPEELHSFNTITSVNVNSGDVTDAKTLLLGWNNTIYVSEQNLFIAYKKNQYWCWGWWRSCGRDYKEEQSQRFFEVVVSRLPEELKNQINEIARTTENKAEQWNLISKELAPFYLKARDGDTEAKAILDGIAVALEEYDTRRAVGEQETIVHKLSLDNGQLEYAGKGTVQGDLLNQFSLDEKEGYLRVATTLTLWVNKRIQSSLVTVLNTDLEEVGKVDEIAPDEQIFAARFLGNKLYLVTFERTDPFFVIDLSDPANPSVVGELQLPGFSQYLHPLDETHIIGIGRDATEEGRAEGVKMALFDVSNPANPTIVDTVTFAEESDSPILNDHKAFLFSTTRGKLVLPLREVVQKERVGEYNYRYEIWNGAYVFGVTTSGFEEAGKVEHSVATQDYYSWWGEAGVKRSVYLDDRLFTISDEFVKVNDWSEENLPLLASISLPNPLPDQLYRRGGDGIVPLIE